MRTSHAFVALTTVGLVAVTALSCGGRSLDDLSNTNATVDASTDGTLPVVDSGTITPTDAGTGSTGVSPTPGAACPRADQTRCANTCVDLRTDPVNCGKCSAACTTAAPLCNAGGCAAA